MTDKQNNSIAISLAAATCTLFGTAPTNPVNAQEDPGWDFDTSFLYYGESDGRVQDASLSLLAKRWFADDKDLTLTLTVDSLTGASASGATPMDVAQTFTSPSGNAVYTIPAGQHPLDDTFLDTRVAISASWQQPLGRLYKVNAGLTASGEYDYFHIGGNVGLSRDFNNRNTTVSVGVAYARDSMDPEGGAPIPFARMLDVGDLSNKMGDQDKDVVDLLLGVTQVVNRNLLVQLNYSYSDSSGYLSDPYKIISMVDGVTGDTVPRTPAPGVEGPSHEFRFESRPENRAKHSLFGQAKYYWDGRVVDVSYRYMTDDWDIDSHTLDAKLRFPMGDNRYLEPHVRFYSQSEAEFYRASLVDSDPLPLYASADYRLGDFDAITAGIKYGWKTASGSDMSVRLEYYRQDGDVPAEQIIGNQSQRNLYPGLDAIIFNFSYRFGR
jgi:opacity protein-like surface antigen